MIGKTLAHYEIIEPLGAGGMGEVYRARDTNLDRDVAIKVLPEYFAADPDRLARFEREAKLLAQLNHANIATIHGLETADGVRFIAMEVVEGQTLADRLASQGRVDVTEALEISRQIADALEAAHGAGIVHRDLKPANVKLTPEGKVKVLDFGLAKELAAKGEPGASADLSHSPTMAAATHTGVILGTASYMSPEQARGHEVDKRTDIWAFGCVLYELLTASTAFGGGTVSDTMAAILKEEPDWGALPDGIPSGVHSLLRRCLRKDPHRRLHDAADARIEIEEALEGRDPFETAAPVSEERPRAIPFGTWIMSVVALGLAAALLVVVVQRPDPPSPPPGRLEFTPPTPIALSPATDALATAQPTVAINAAGNLLVFVGTSGAESRLYLRPMGDYTATEIPGTEGAYAPFFSPDSQWVGFFADNILKKVALGGGQVVALAEAANPRGAVWRDDDSIVFSHVQGRALSVVPASGREGATRIDDRPINLRWPSRLPFPLLLMSSGLSTALGSEMMVVNQQTNEASGLGLTGIVPKLLPTGHIVFLRDQALWAAPFDADALEVTGAEQPIEPSVRLFDYAMSENGTLVYVPVEGYSSLTLVWLDESGAAESAGFDGDDYGTYQLSPDGTRLAVEVRGLTADVWIYDLATRNRRKITSEGNNRYPVWSPDGRWIVFRSDRSGVFNLWRTLASGAGVAEQLTESDVPDAPYFWSADPERIWFIRAGDILTLDVESGQVDSVITGQVNASMPTVAGNGELLAYSTSASGNSEVYLQRLPDGEAFQVSDAGGEEPVWSRTADVLFYRNGLQWFRVDVPDDLERIPSPRLVFEGNYRNVGGRSYEVAADGRFLLLRPEMTPATKVNVVLNFFELLREQVPAGR